MSLDTNIPLRGITLDTATPLLQFAQQRRQQEQDRARAEQTNVQNQRQATIDTQQAELTDAKIAQQKIANLGAREQQRLKSSVLGAAQLNTFLESDNIKGARDFLEGRRADIGNRIAAGENVDTTETDDALRLLQENPGELLNLTRSSITFGQQVGILEAAAGQQDFSLSPGQQRFDARGNLIAQVSPKSDVLSPEAFQQKEALRRAGQPITDISISTGEKAFSKEFGRQNAQTFFKRRDGALDARKTLDATTEAEALLDRGIISGAGANVITGFGKILIQAGLIQKGGNTSETIANTEAFVAQRAQEVGRIIKLFGAGTGLSDADREFATKAAAGDVTLTESSIRRILTLGTKAARTVITKFNKDASQIDSELSPFDLIIELPPKAEKPADDLIFLPDEQQQDVIRLDANFNPIE